MRFIKSLCVAGMFVLASSSFAAVFADVSVIPGPVGGQVSFSRPAGDPAGPNKPPKYPAVTTNVVYKATVFNDQPNTINHVRVVLLTGSISGNYVPPQPDGPTGLVFSRPLDLENLGVSCGFEGVPAQFVCNVQQLRAGQTATFYMVFTVPLSPADGSAGPFIANYTWQVFYGEGANDAMKAAHADGSFEDFPTAVELVTFTTGAKAKDLKTVVPAGNGLTEFFTGTGIPTSLDTIITKLGVPDLPPGVPTAIAEVYERKPGELPPSSDPAPLVCPTELPTCTDIIIVRVPDVAFSAANPLKITIIKDAKSWTGNANSVPFYYQHQDGDPQQLLKNCSLTVVPEPGKPCISDRKKLTKNDSPDPEAPGDLRVILDTIDNGRITN